IGSYGFAFGVLAATSGLGWVAVLVMSTLVYGGGAQAAFVGALAIGTPATALVSGVLVNLRLGIYGTIANRILAAESLPRRLVGVHLASDETIALTAGAEPEARTSTYWLSGVVFFVIWATTTLAGVLAGDAIGDPETLGLDAAFPSVFVALLLPMLNAPATRVAAAAAAVVTLVVTPHVAAGLPILAAAGTALVAAALLGRASKR
ncbi:MAG: branched-chain amino acid ABC transporter permease, partial [Actinomycetia bacterium]|nr:branched-chain amino acid ABC transporter permease [Actinomycetes bacterium]